VGFSLLPIYYSLLSIAYFFSHPAYCIFGLMNMVEGKIVHLLTGKHSLDEVTVNELKTIADNQPYFSVVQLLLAKKMKQENHPEYLQQVQKTALYFPNVHWLHYQLNNEFEQEQSISAEKKNEDPAETVRPSTGDESMITFIDEQPEDEQQTAAFERPTFVEPQSRDEQETIAFKKPVLEPEESLEETSTDESTEVESPVDREIFVPLTSEEISQSAEPDTLIEEAITNPPSFDDDILDTPSDLDTPEPDQSSSRLAGMIEQQVKEFQKEVTPESKLPIEPEPFHTVDYFASQGIKLNAQQMQQDQLGSRVRKFTDWLKQMKRVQTDTPDLGTDPESEHVVQGIAANSNKGRDIVTEAMAEVLVKQGKKDKAVQLYIKLSFLNPDKSAYFAAKIQELKGI
jgi:hypothetical protein